MNKGFDQNYFEDFHVGQTFECPTPRVLTNADRALYIAFTGDRMPRFCDAHNRIHPLTVFHTVLSQTVKPISFNAVANLGYAEVAWRQPVHIGDTISTTATIIGLKENSGRRDGIVYVRTVGKNQWNEVVLEYVRWVMVRKSREYATPYLDAPVVPGLQSALAPKRLTLHPPDQCYHKATGGKYFYEDYEPGERIVHLGTVTVSEAEHMSFTRLYQNAARLHFETIPPHTAPVVFGGYAISLGYALSFIGLENRLGLVGINSGVHPHPVHAGDTLACFTDLIEKVEVHPHVGLLRLRLVVVKNYMLGVEMPFEPQHEDATGKQVYNDHVVLDLDYWEPVITRAHTSSRPA